MMNVPVAEQNTLAFRLSSEELLYLLSALNLKTIPDLGGEPFGDITEEQKNQILMAGFNGLRAKEWIQLSEDEEAPIVVDKLFASTLLTCATSTEMLSVEMISRSKPLLQVYFYRSLDIFVVHRLVDTGLHEFVVTSEQADAIAMFEKMVDLNYSGQSSALSGFLMSNEEAPVLMQSIQDRDLDVIRKALQNVGIDDDIANEFLACLEDLSHVVNLTLINFSEYVKSVDDLSANSVSVLNATESSWIIKNKDSAGAHFAPLSYENLEPWVCFFSE